MTDTPELNVWREAMNAYYVNDRIEDGTAAAAVIRSYGDERYQAAIADVVDGWGKCSTMTILSTA